jgi:hypothetical protein
VKYSIDLWGPKPFRFNNFWLENNKFVKEVEAYWRGTRIEGWMGFVLKEKLKGLKFFIKDWSKREYGGLEDRIQGLVVDIGDLDVRGEDMGLTIQEVESRRL